MNLITELARESRDRLYLPPDPSEERAFGPTSASLLPCGFTDQEVAAAPAVLLLPDEDDDFFGASDDPLDGLGLALRHRGRKIKKVDGWRDRGRTGLWLPRGVMEHHTASSLQGGNAPSLGIVTHGRPDLPGPLSNFLIGRDGTIFFVAAGRCNHAGFGGPLKGIPKDSGNAYLFGIEVENNGLGEPWGDETRKSMILLTALLLRRVDRHARMAVAHKEWAPGRKIDPKGIGMERFRENVHDKMKQVA
jgi:hypothetical protein